MKFCSGRDAFTFALQPENARRLTGFFVQSADTDPKAPVTAESFLDARKAFFVVDGRFEGVMGAEPPLLPTKRRRRNSSKPGAGASCALKK